MRVDRFIASRLWYSAAVAAAAALLLSPHVLAQSYSISNLGNLGGSFTYAYAINAAGQVVGSSVTANGTTSAFLWQSGDMTDLGAVSGEAYAINNFGQVVGYSSLSDSNQQAFIWLKGVMTFLNTLIPAGSGWELNQACAINNSGQIVGNGTLNGAGPQAFLLTPNSVAITAPASGADVKGTVTVTGTITDAAKTATWTLTCGGTEVGSGTGISPRVSWNTMQWADGSHMLSLTEKDTAGHTLSASITVIIVTTQIPSTA